MKYLLKNICYTSEVVHNEIVDQHIYEKQLSQKKKYDCHTYLIYALDLKTNSRFG